MAENENGQEKNQDATEKRIRESREKGQIPRSRELSTVAVTVAAAATFLVIGGEMVMGLAHMAETAFTPAREEIFDTGAMARRLALGVWQGFAALVPFFIIMTLVAILSTVVIGGWNFSTQALAPKPERISLIKGLQRMVSIKSLVELVKTLLKFALVLGTTVMVFLAFEQDFISLGLEPFHQGLAHAGNLLAWGFLAFSLVLIVVALIDVPYQLWEHNNNLKMTLQEVKDEFKQTEGKPEVKQRIRQLQYEMSQRRMMEEVPKADVVITNPTHFSIALRYDAQTGEAPIVVAKGVDEMAMHIRKIANAHEVPLFEAPPLARALFYNVQLGDPIPAALYTAVAQVLAYIFQLRDAASYASPTPQRPDPAVPDELWRGRDPDDGAAATP